jgi:AmiR/NasT family two-component response regulator
MSKDKQKIKILIVEDEALIALDIKQKLIEIGYDVVGVADNGAAAVKLALEFKPEVILMDIVIKGPLNGIETAKMIKKQMNTAIIYLTAYSNPSVMEQAMRTNPGGYLLKPFDDSKLQSVIVELNIDSALDR